MPPSAQRPDIHPTLRAVLTCFSLTAVGPVSDQQILFSVLDDVGIRKPEPIPYSPDLPAPFTVDLSPLSDLTKHGSFVDIAQDDDLFYQRHRVTVTEFLLLLSVLEPHLSLSREQSNSASHPSSHGQAKLTPALQLLLWFYYTKGVPLSLVTDLFNGLHRTTLLRTVKHVTQCIRTTLSDLIRWPTPDERKALYGLTAVCDKAIGYLDGTHCAIRRPSKDSKPYYSSYKHKYTQNYLVAVNPFAVVIFLEGPYPGRANDRGDYNECSLAIHCTQFFSEGELLLADGGFMGGPGLLVPMHADIIIKAESEQKRDDYLLFNEVLSEARVVVEDVFSWLKARARILERVFPGRKGSQYGVFEATCLVYNFTRLLRIQYSTLE